MDREARREAGAVTECTLLQLVACLDELGLSGDELPRVLHDVLRSGRVRLVGASGPWLSRTGATRNRAH
jgi:hypothetical protein